MYKLAFHVFRMYWLPVLFASVILFLLDIWGQGSIGRSLVPTLMVYGYLAFAFHYTLLTGATTSVFKTSGQTPSPNWSFWVAFILPIFFLLLAMGIAFFIVKAKLPAEMLPGDAALGFAMLVSLPLFGLLLAAIGTMIPAAAIQASTGVRAALKRARRSFWFILWRLITGPTVFTLVFVGVTLTLAQQGLDPAIPETFAGITVSNATYHTVAGFLGIFNTALTASIFSMAYTWVEEGRKLQLSG
ncbi:hypothetical protein [Ruegeria arenilitoris]|uniref:hypothetical protein n=1 Tax=Ruegeria arenilitoris TaxID=1173585 RepID=UPI001480B146|nr:hypothetical protein [Ruegeria arenilitoris]